MRSAAPNFNFDASFIVAVLPDRQTARFSCIDVLALLMKYMGWAVVLGLCGLPAWACSDVEDDPAGVAGHGGGAGQSGEGGEGGVAHGGGQGGLAGDAALGAGGDRSIQNAAGDGGDGGDGASCDFGSGGDSFGEPATLAQLVGAWDYDGPADYGTRRYLSYYFLPNGKGGHANMWIDNNGDQYAVYLDGSFDIGPHVIVFNSEGGSSISSSVVHGIPVSTTRHRGPETLSFPYVYDAAHDALCLKIQDSEVTYRLTHTSRDPFDPFAPLDPGAAGAGGSGD